MTKLTSLLFIILFYLSSPAQEKITGVVSENQSGELKPLPGANIFWLGTQRGTSAGDDGSFSLDKTTVSNKLVVSMMGYRADTLVITTQKHLDIVLQTEAHKLKDVEVVGKTGSTFSDYLDVQNKSVMTEKELCKAACCNLSESFETNPSIDVSFSDAITGAKQIEMLGLSGIYTQTTMENIPSVRGLQSNSGLSSIPGTWVKAINVSKGIGSVANGFESITGQIDIDMRKPLEEDSETMFLNLYGDYDQRFEGNLNYRVSLTDELSVITLLHASSRSHSVDNNKDLFTDMPRFSSFNIMQRWNYMFSDGWVGQFGFHAVKDDKSGGTISSHANSYPAYKYETDLGNLSFYGKIGYVFPDDEHKSFGLQLSYNDYNNKSVYGIKKYSGDQKTGYLNFLYQSHFISEQHEFRTGFGILYDQFSEHYQDMKFNRTEKVPGAFFEYTFSPDETFSAILGLRGDYHNFYGTMFSPRLHLRYAPQEDWILRLAAGRGYRSSNIFTEYASVLTSNRQVIINGTDRYGYGLQQEKAWNYGLNLTHYFVYNYSESTISLDLYRTDFESLTIADMDTHPGEISFSSVKNGAYSYTAQVELNIQPLERLETRAAYRFMNVKQKINGEYLTRPFTSMNRALLNFAYTTETETDNDPKMVYDMTLQWFSKKRLPSTASNPSEFRAREYSPSYVVVNAQVTRSFSEGFDLYIGIENLFDFRQTDIIIDPLNPNGQFFDASLIWGPVNSRMTYAGLRWRL